MNLNTGIVRFSYLNVWKPRANKSGKLKYSVCALVMNTQVDDIKIYEEAMFDALREGILNPKCRFTQQQVNASISAYKTGPQVTPVIKLPLRDGNYELKIGKKKGDDWKDLKFFNANSDNQPGITKPQDGQAVIITDPLEVYSGCNGRLAVSFYPYNTEGSMGVAVGLNGVYKVGEGERLDGRINAVDEFSKFAAEDGAVPGAEANSDPFSG